MNATMSAPLDVRLMNVTASLLFWSVAALGIVVVFWWVLRHPQFAFSAVRVEGDVIHSNAVTIRANAVHRLSGNFFTLDLSAARSAFETVPWVRRAVVRREFPDHLVVNLQEHEPVAYWGAEEGSQMVNRQGEIFEANQGDLEGDDLPRLNGPAGSSASIWRMYGLLNPLFETIDASVESLNLSERGSWQATLDSGAAIELGRGTEAEIVDRVSRFVRTAGQSAARFGRAPDAIESADLRHPNGYALRIRGVTTVTGETAKPKATTRPAAKTGTTVRTVNR